MSEAVHSKLTLPFGHLAVSAHSGRIRLADVIARVEYEQELPGLPYELVLGETPAHPPRCYRESMLARGVYLGHHFGSPVAASIERDRMTLKVSDSSPAAYNRIIWTYVVKVLLTIGALNADAVHVKAATVEDGAGNCLLLVGRGQSGKSTLAKTLERWGGWRILGNTHAVAREAWVWGVPTWTRWRNPEGSESYLAANGESPGDALLRGICIVEHNKAGRFEAIEVDASRWIGFLRNYVCAIGAYDLKEDLFDWDIEGMSGFERLQLAYDLFDAFTKSAPLYHVSADVLESESRAAVVNWAAGLVRQ